MPTWRVAPRLFGGCGDGAAGSFGGGRTGFGGRCVPRVVVVSVMVSDDSFLSMFLGLLTPPVGLIVEASLAVELEGVDGASSPASKIDPLALAFPFVATVVFFGVVPSFRGGAGPGGLPIDSLFSTALAAAAFPAAALFVNDTGETLDLADAGRLGTGGSFEVSTFFVRGAVLVLAIEDVAEAVDAVDVRRGRIVLPGPLACRPAVTFEVVDATDPRREVLTSDLAVLNTVDASLLVETVDPGLGSFLVDRVEPGLTEMFDGPVAATPALRIVDACERTESTDAATDVGRSLCVTLPATLFLLDTVERVGLDARDVRDACDACDGGLDALDVVPDFCDAFDGAADLCDACDGALGGARDEAVDVESDAAGPLARTPDVRDVVDATDRMELAEDASVFCDVLDLAILRLSTLARRDVMLAVSPSPSGLPAVDKMVGRSPVRVGGPFVGDNKTGRMRSSTDTSSSATRNEFV